MNELLFSAITVFNNIDYLIDHANVSLRSASSLKNNWASP